jgi:hypothetical protein
MDVDTDKPTKGWTVETYAVHNEAMRSADEKFQAERDRRYTETNIEREKALKIKETADLAALGLAREIQTYKDEKANELRSQIESERGTYATRSDLQAATEKLEITVKPLVEYAVSQQGKMAGVDKSWAVFATIATIALGFITAIAYIFHH